MNLDTYARARGSEFEFSRSSSIKMERFAFESCVRGYHVYKDIGEASVGEELPCQRENGNHADPFAVAIVKSGVTVRHIPRKISSVCSLFLCRSGFINICTTGRRRFSVDLPQGGLEIPCAITFEGVGKDVRKARKLVTAALSTTAISLTDEVQPSKRIKIEHSVEGHNGTEAEADTSEWLRCAGAFLTNYDRKVLATGQKLTDQHINFAQALLRLQFPTLNGLQSTVYQSRTQGFKASAHALQVIHCHGEHWVVATTIQCPPGEVKVYDSVYASVDDGTLRTVQSMFGSHTGLQMTAVNAPKQQGGSDCGVFAIAVSTCLAFGGDPAKKVICQSRVRDHLLKCFEEKVLTQF